MHNIVKFIMQARCRWYLYEKNLYGSGNARGFGRWENANFHQLGADHGMAGTWTWETMALLVSGKTPETPYECA